MPKLTLITAALAITVATAHAAGRPQVVIPTPAGVAPLPNTIYEIPYAVSGRSPSGGFQSETVVTVGNLRSTPTTCRIQVEWINWAGVIVGYPGPGSIPLNGTLEFTTTPNGGVVDLGHFTQNVFRNSDVDFEGHARLRTTCSAANFRVDAQALDLGPNFNLLNYEDIKVIRASGNVGD